MSDEAPAQRRFRVTVIEWLSHDAYIEATTPEAAEEEALRLWAEGNETETFSFNNSGVDGVVVEEI